MASTEKVRNVAVAVTLPAVVFFVCVLIGLGPVDAKSITFHPSMSNNNHRVPREIVMPFGDEPALFNDHLQESVTRTRRMDSTSFTLTQGSMTKDSFPTLPANSTSAVSISICILV